MMMKTNRNGGIDWGARITEGWAALAISILAAACLISVVVPPLYHLTVALNLALRLPGLH
jgi:hypothetical protein